MAQEGRKTRLLIVTRNFPPVAGGMERLLFHCYEELRSSFRVSLVAPSEGVEFASDAEVFQGFGISPVGWSLVQSAWKAIRVARAIKPALVLAGSGVMVPAALAAARLSGARSACYLHGLDVIAPSAVYQRLFVRQLHKFDLLIANSRATADRVRQVVGSRCRVEILNPGVSTPQAKAPAALTLRRRLGLEDRARILLSVGRLTDRKGLVEFVERVMPRLLAENGETHLVVIGEEPRHALRNASGLRERLLAVAESVGARSSVHMLGRVDDDLLVEAYRAADVHVFPVKRVPGDMEGFGMVAIEAAAHGLPTVAFNEGGIADAVCDGVSGHLIASGDYEAFGRSVLERLAGADRASWVEQCRQYARGFSWEHFGERLRKLCQDTIDGRAEPAWSAHCGD